MKKLVLMLAVVFGMSFVSCGNATTEETANDSTVVDTVAIDTIVADTLVVDSVK